MSAQDIFFLLKRWVLWEDFIQWRPVIRLNSIYGSQIPWLESFWWKHRDESNTQRQMAWFAYLSISVWMHKAPLLQQDIFKRVRTGSSWDMGISSSMFLTRSKHPVWILSQRWEIRTKVAIYSLHRCIKWAVSRWWDQSKGITILRPVEFTDPGYAEALEKSTSELVYPYMNTGCKWVWPMIYGPFGLYSGDGNAILFAELVEITNVKQENQIWTGECSSS